MILQINIIGSAASINCTIFNFSPLAVSSNFNALHRIFRFKNLLFFSSRYLKAYRVRPQDGLREIYKDFLNNDTSCIHGVSIASQSRDFLSNQNYRSTDDDFHTFFHPIYGLCIEFQPSRSTKDITGSIGVKSMKIDVNFTRAFSNFG